MMLHCSSLAWSKVFAAHGGASRWWPDAALNLWIRCAPCECIEVEAGGTPMRP